MRNISGSDSHHIEKSKIGEKFEKNLALVLSNMVFLFLIWGHLRISVFTAIPSIVFLILIIFDLNYVKSVILKNKKGFSLFALTLVFGTILSQLPMNSIKGVYDFFRGVAIMIPVAWLVQHHKETFLKVFPWVTLPSALLVIGVIVYAQLQVGAAEKRAVLDQLFNQYNVFGHGVGVLYVCMLCFGLYEWKQDRLAGFAWLLVVSILLATVLLSGSRGSLVACILVSTLIFSFYQPKWTLLFWVGGFLLVGGAFYLYKLSASGGLAMWDRGGDLTAGRLDIYVAAIEAWWQQGRWFGFGPNTYKYLEFGHAPGGPIPMPHNVLLELLGSLGLVGSLTFLTGFGLFFSRIPWRRVGGDLITLLGVSLLFYMLVRGMFDLKLWGAYYPGMIMLGIGLAISFDNSVEKPAG